VNLLFIQSFFILLFHFQKYQIIIKDEQQPLIVVKGNKRMVKRGPKKEDQAMVFLIPELCCVTGQI
jgi:hypothetical protein